MLRVRRQPAPAALEILELNMPREADANALDLVLSFVTPRSGHGEPYLDVGVLYVDDAALSARSSRADVAGRGRGAPLTAPLSAEGGSWRGRWAGAAFDLGITPIAHRGGVMLARARGEIVALDQTIRLDDRLLFVSERRAARRPYAWTFATLRTEIDGQPLICLIETARRRAGSVVLPELGRMRLFGPGARALPRACALSPLPIRAEYGTGRLRAVALAPGVRVELVVDAPPESTALFEVVDPNGDAAYAHRAPAATARLTITRRREVLRDLALTGRYEWGARAGDPRVAHRAWRA